MNQWGNSDVLFCRMITAFTIFIISNLSDKYFHVHMTLPLRRVYSRLHDGRAMEILRTILRLRPKHCVCLGSRVRISIARPTINWPLHLKDGVHSLNYQFYKQFLLCLSSNLITGWQPVCF